MATLRPAEAGFGMNCSRMKLKQPINFSSCQINNHVVV